MIKVKAGQTMELRPGSLYKYVRMDDGEFRFIEANCFEVHTQLVEQGEDEENIISAGTIGISWDEPTFKFTDYESISLNIPWFSEDVVLLSRILQRVDITND